MIVVVLVLIGFLSTMAVNPQDAGAPANEFSATRAMAHVSEIAREPHPMGTAANGRVRSYLVAELEALGLELDLQTVSAPNVFGSGEPVDVVNVIAWIPGTANTKAVVLLAHYDTVPDTPGANDNSAAVAALLETARALQSGPPLANDIVFLFSDAEEPSGPSGHFGARAFASVPGLVDDLGLIVNFEANGGSGASMLVQTSGPRSWLVNEYTSAAADPVVFSFLTEITELIGEVGTDFDVFKDAGVPGLHFAYLRGSPIYHTQADDVDSVGAGSLQHHGANAVAVARRFGDMDLAEEFPSGDAVFFTIRPFVVQYPAAWALWLAVAAAGGFGLAVRGSRQRIASVIRSGGVSLLAPLVGAVAGTVAWMVIAAVRSTPGVAESYLYLAVLLGVGVFVARWLEDRIGHSNTSTRRLGRVSVWVALALLTGLTSAGFSYLFVWPAIAAVVGLMWRPTGGRWGLACFVLIAVPTLLLMTPAIDSLFLFSQPRPGNPGSQILSVVVVPLLLALLVIDLLGSGWHRTDEALARP
jgi:hypothetical protein